MRPTKIFPLSALIVILVGLLFVSGCSTKKNTFTRRTYHNLTAHYNVYWNGMDNLRQGVKEYQASLKDNYSLVLPVYNYGDKSSATKLSQYADVAIKKGSKAINKHSMVFNRKEYVRWIDDAYLLIGLSHFYKQDYALARRTFEFVIKTYNYDDIKYEAMLWQARSNIQTGDFNRAEPMLDMLLSKVIKGDAPAEYELEVNLTYGQFHILQKQFDAAVPYLQRALELGPRKAMRSRVEFILGQIYQKSDDLDDAARMYASVIRHPVNYDMEFNAKINLAQCYNSKSGDRDYIIKKLSKMLKDDKNKDYLDQVYYALAHIAMQDSDTTLAIEHLRSSVSNSKSNNYQKAISSLELADIFFGAKDYTLAQAYYDSTMQFLPQDYPNYKELKKLTMTLTDLVKNLNIIQLQDSLQRLAAMPEDQRNRVFDKIIAKLVEEEMQKQRAEQLRMENLILHGETGSQSQQGVGSKEGRWYFYNPTTMSNGFSTFTRKWGKRKLEDNWFLTDKTVVDLGGEPEGSDTLAMAGDSVKGKGKEGGKAKNPKERAYYLKDLPLTKEQVIASNEKMIDAYYEAGFIFDEGLEDFGNSAKTFETLLERFPDNEYKAQSAYKLCELYALLENQAKSDEYRNLILNQFPESDYAKLLVNPNYYKEITARQSDASKLYKDTFKAFTNQQYYMVINNADIARSKFRTDSLLMPKFEYLRGLAIGKIEVVDSLVSAMNKVITEYPKSDVKPLAENVLAFLGAGKAPDGKTLPGDSTAKAPDQLAQLYKYDPNAVHFYVLVVNNDLVDVDALKVKIADYNEKFHSLQQLKVNSIMLDDFRQMVTVSNFNNGEEAQAYFMGILTSKYIFTKLENAGEYFNFVISVENYPVLYRNKDISQYLRFFEKNYPAIK